uniref:CRAL/TRIO domain protein n=1 Tax=Toxoplasma gondii COUG TaxID=1074873 RepID=A0A2G8Y6L3_TOXGO|nr:hypothetical protein TGCOUG_228760 [Toxoplasma gondii COUG]
MALPVQFSFVLSPGTSNLRKPRQLTRVAAASQPLARSLPWRSQRASRGLVFGVAVALATVLCFTGEESLSVASVSLFPAVTSVEAADRKPDGDSPKKAGTENSGNGGRHQKAGHSRRHGSRSHGKTWKRPPPMPEHRVQRALSMFENVHGQMTLFFKGFSREGSVVAYDLLDELRTVKEATYMMDVEFLVLDRVMDHYKSQSHLRIVDTKIMCKFLDLSNLLPWRIPGVLSAIKKMVLEYQPVLQQFLNRYEHLIEALILTSVPTALHPFRALVAALLGVPRNKLVFASSLEDLEKFIPRDDIPVEFWNPTGGPVREGWENKVSWRIMLEEVQQKLGADSVTPAGKLLLQNIKDEEARREPSTHSTHARAAGGDASSGAEATDEKAESEELVITGQVNAEPPGVSGTEGDDVSSSEKTSKSGDFSFGVFSSAPGDDGASFDPEDFDDVD